MRLLRLAVLSYSWSRHLIYGEVLAAGVVAWRGMVAGCVAATRELKLYLYDALTGVVIRNPSAEIDSWVDDIATEVHDECSKRAVNAATAAV